VSINYLKREVLVETLCVYNKFMTYFKRIIPFTLLCASLFCLAVLLITPTEAGASSPNECEAKLGAYTPSLNNGRAFSLGTVKTDCDQSDVTIKLTSGSLILAQRHIVSHAANIRVTTPSVRWKGCKTVRTHVIWVGGHVGWGYDYNEKRSSAPRKICF
jgi:hypothetical protein